MIFKGIYNQLARAVVCFNKFGVWGGAVFLTDVIVYKTGIFLKVEDKMKGKIRQINYGGKPLQYRSCTTDLMMISSILIGYKDVWPITPEYEFHLRFRPDWVIDLGANIGLFSIYFSQKYPKIDIVAVEPEKSNYKILQKNLHPYLNQTNKIVPLNAGIWYRDSFLKIVNPECGKCGFRCAEVSRSDTDSFAGISVNSILEKYHVSGRILVKMDIEGAEQFIFRDENADQMKWIFKIEVFIIEIHEYMHKGLTELITKKMEKYGFMGSPLGDVVVFRKAHY